MLEQINRLVDINLNHIASESGIGLFLVINLIDEKGQKLEDNLAENLAKRLLDENLIVVENPDRTKNGIFFFRLSHFALEVLEIGGWLAFLEREEKEKNENEEMKKIETQLALSNIEANKLNKELARQNARDRKINMVLIILNIVFAAISVINIFFEL